MIEILRRAVAAAAMVCLVVSCGSSSTRTSYDAAIQGGQRAAEELLEQGACAVTIALVSPARALWC